MDAIRYSIEEGQKNGEFRDGISRDTACDLLCGPIFFRLMAHPEDITETFRKEYPGEAIKVILPSTIH